MVSILPQTHAKTQSEEINTALVEKERTETDLGTPETNQTDIVSTKTLADLRNYLSLEEDADIVVELGKDLDLA